MRRIKKEASQITSILLFGCVYPLRYLAILKYHKEDITKNLCHILLVETDKSKVRRF